MAFKDMMSRTFSGARRTALQQRVTDLERDIAELREQNLRLAEMADVIQELLIPMASRDQDRIDAAIEKFQKGL